jgi:hypothetical protein
MSMSAKLDHHHRHTVEHLFAHPVGHNIQWRDVRCLLERFGEVFESHRGGWVCAVDGVTTSLGRVRGRELSVEQVMRVRHLLSGLGVSATGEVAA